MNIPSELKAEARWVNWKNEKKNGKFTKIPYDPKTGQFAKSNDSSTWASFEVASEKADPFNNNPYDGVGFMLAGSEFTGIDFDGVVDDGVPEPYVMNIISQIGNPYCEITPSGTGLRSFIKESRLPPGNRKFNAKKKGVEKYGAEIYAGSEGGRYLTLTGDRYSGESIPKIENIDLVYFLISKFPDEHFRRLWMGDASEYENDESRVDLALLGVFARAFNGDDQKMMRFFNASVPGRRPKWRTREDYRNLTFAKAMSGLSMSSSAWNKFVEQPRKIIAFQSEPWKSPTNEKCTAFHYIVKAISDQFDGWFPLGSPCLLGGSSGSGKTTFMLDLCETQFRGQKFFDHETFRRKYLVLMLDRGRDSHVRTMRRMGYMDSQGEEIVHVPIKFLSPAVDGDASQQIIDRIEETNPRPELVFIEGMDMLVSDPNALEVVMPFMHEMQAIAQHYHIALVGSVGAPKSKPKEGYAAKRDTIFGSAVWSRMAETIVTMQYPNGDDTENRRVICILPRNSLAEKFETEFQHGKLAVVAPIEGEDEKSINGRPPEAAILAREFLESQLQSNPIGMARGEIIRRAKLAGIAESTLDRVAEGLVTKNGRFWVLQEIHAIKENIPQKGEKVTLVKGKEFFSRETHNEKLF